MPKKLTKEQRKQLKAIAAKQPELVVDAMEKNKVVAKVVKNKMQIFQGLRAAFLSEREEGVEKYLELHATLYLRNAIKYPQHYHLLDEVLYQRETNPEKKEELRLIAEKSKALYDRVLADMEANKEKVKEMNEKGIHGNMENELKEKVFELNNEEKQTLSGLLEETLGITDEQVADVETLDTKDALIFKSKGESTVLVEEFFEKPPALEENKGVHTIKKCGHNPEILNADTCPYRSYIDGNGIMLCNCCDKCKEQCQGDYNNDEKGLANDLFIHNMEVLSDPKKKGVEFWLFEEEEKKGIEIDCKESPATIVASLGPLMEKDWRNQCQCGNPAKPLHICPLKEDALGDNKSLCGCCDDCEKECAADI